MITITYSTHKDQEYNNKFRQHLLQTVYNSGITKTIYDIKLKKD